MELVFTLLQLCYVLWTISLIVQTVLFIKYATIIVSYFIQKHKTKLELNKLQQEGNKRTKEEAKCKKEKATQKDIDSLPDCWRTLYHSMKDAGFYCMQMDILRYFCKQDDDNQNNIPKVVYLITGSHARRILDLMMHRPITGDWYNSSEQARVTEASALIAPFVGSQRLLSS